MAESGIVIENWHARESYLLIIALNHEGHYDVLDAHSNLLSRQVHVKLQRGIKTVAFDFSPEAIRGIPAKMAVYDALESALAKLHGD